MEEKIELPAIRRSLKRTAEWFRQSGVMRPADGSWGIAERVFVTDNNPKLEQVYRSFSAWTEHDGYSIIEQRRPDCNMEAVLMFLLMNEISHEREDYQTAYNLLDYLYRRSGMLLRTEIKDSYAAGIWNWSHIRWTAPAIWYDDNSWVCMIQLMTGARYPELDREFELTLWGRKLAEVLAAAFLHDWPEADDKKQTNPSGLSGTLPMPHWGGLVCMAVSRAWRSEPKEIYRKVTEIYIRHLQEKKDSFNNSEICYAVLTLCMMNKAFHDPESLELAQSYADRLLAQMDPQTGNIPAQHWEAPSGEHLADTIYTLNWAVLALQCMASLVQKDSYDSAYRKLLNLLLKIQDASPEKQFRGCWRGMFDMKAGVWGGGESYEGGAGSIYTGWTNAPIAWAVAGYALKQSLLDY